MTTLAAQSTSRVTALAASCWKPTSRYRKVFLFVFAIRKAVQDHAEKAAGIILIGSYLPDLFGDQSNAFPVPVLTVVGELDGMTISYVYRSVKSQGGCCG